MNHSVCVLALQMEVRTSDYIHIAVAYFAIDWPIGMIKMCQHYIGSLGGFAITDTEQNFSYNCLLAS